MTRKTALDISRMKNDDHTRVPPQKPLTDPKPKLPRLRAHGIALLHPRRDHSLCRAPKANAASTCPNEIPYVLLNQGALR